MVKKTFVLRNKKTYRRGVRIFIKGKDGKISDRLLNFTTEHLVDEKQRATNARKIQAEYKTDNAVVIAAMFTDSAYGKDFYLKGDEEGALREATIVITSEDSKKVALRNLFELAELPFDGSKTFDVLSAEYNIYAQALSGRKIERSTAKEVPIKVVNVSEEIEAAKNRARALYKEKSGEEIPAEVRNDTAFLDGLSNPKFDAQRYIDKLNEPKDTAPDSKEELSKSYFEKFGKNVPTTMKNNVEWIKGKLAD